MFIFQSFFFPIVLSSWAHEHRPAVLHNSDGLNMLLAKIHNTAAALAPQHPSIAVTSWAMAALWGEGVTQLSLSSLKHSNVPSKWLNGKTADQSLQFSTLKLLKQQTEMCMSTAGGRVRKSALWGGRSVNRDREELKVNPSHYILFLDSTRGALNESQLLVYLLTVLCAAPQLIF